MRPTLYYFMLLGIAGMAGYIYYEREADRLDLQYSVHAPIVPQVDTPAPPDPAADALAFAAPGERDDLWSTDADLDPAATDQPRDDRPRTRDEVTAEMGPPQYTSSDQRVWVYASEAVIFRGQRVVGWVDLDDGANPFGGGGNEPFLAGSKNASFVQAPRSTAQPGKGGQGKVYRPSANSAGSKSRRGNAHDNRRFDYSRNRHQTRTTPRVQQRFLQNMFNNSSSSSRSRNR